MGDLELYKTIGKLEQSVSDIKDMLKTHIEKSEKKDDNHEGRLQSIELIVGKITLKLAAASIAIMAVVYKVIDYAWDKFAN